MYEVPSSPKRRLLTARRVMRGMLTLFILLFASGYMRMNWRCGGCNDPHLWDVVAGAAIVGVSTFLGSIIYWHDLGEIQRLAGVLLPLLCWLVWSATVLKYVLYW